MSAGDMVPAAAVPAEPPALRVDGTARDVDARIGRLLARGEQVFLAVALNVSRVLGEGLHRELGFDSFEAWAEERHRLKPETARAWARVGRQMQALPPEARRRVAELGYTRARLVLPALQRRLRAAPPEAAETEAAELLAGTESLSTRALEQRLRQDGDAPDLVRIDVLLPAADREEFMELLAYAMRRSGVRTGGSALLDALREYYTSNPEEEPAGPVGPEPPPHPGPVTGHTPGGFDPRTVEAPPPGAGLAATLAAAREEDDGEGGGGDEEGGGAPGDAPAPAPTVTRERTLELAQFVRLGFGGEAEWDAFTRGGTIDLGGEAWRAARSAGPGAVVLEPA